MVLEVIPSQRRDITLNAAQQDAVDHREGPCLVLAGPGSGKTRVIVERVVALAQEGVPLDQILVLTFTIGAAQEMFDRAVAALPEGSEPRLCNFHTFSRQLLAEQGHRIGLSRHWRRVSAPERWLLARDILAEWRPTGLYNPLQPWGLVRDLLDVVEEAKQELITPEQYEAWAAAAVALMDPVADPEGHEQLRRHAVVAEFYRRLEERTRQLGLLDYDDQILFAQRLLRDFPASVTAMTRGVRYLMVDEFQDTNIAQARLVEALVAVHHNLMVIADDDQSIYKFRGASLANLERFGRLYPAHRTIILDVNYRSTPQIVQATRALIAQAGTVGRREKVLVAHRPSGAAVELWRSPTERSESMAIALECKRLIEEDGVPAGQIAWLFSRHDDMTVPMQVLQEAGVAYQVQGGHGFFNQPEVQALMALLRAVADPDDGQAVLRTLQLPLWQVSPAGRRTIVDAARRDDTPLIERLRSCDPGLAIAELSEEDAASARTAADALVDLHVRSQSTDVVNILIDAVEAAGYLGIPELAREIESAQAVANLQKFQRLLEDFCEFSSTDNRLSAALDYLEAVRLSRTEDALGQIAGRADAVILMTCHASKGLEFSVVVVSHAAEFRWPGRGGPSALFSIPDDLIEEPAPPGDARIDEARRLLYVAMTRARDRLIIASADRYARSLGNKDERISPFVTQALEPGSIAIVRKDFVQERVVHARRPDAPVRAQDVQPSVHDLKAFRDCPRQYQYRAVWRMPVHQTPAQWFGSLLHGVLEGAGRLRLEGEEVGGTQLAAWFEEAWLKAPRAYLRGDRPDLRSLGAELLTRYGDSKLWTRAHLSAVEEPFTLRRSQVRGRIDRIDEGPEAPVIVDYKAGRAPADERRLSGDLQVRSYALRGAEMAGREEAVVELHYLQDLRAVRVHFDAGMLRTAGGHVGATADDIRRAHAVGDFPMKPGDWVCNACPYSTVCTKGKR